MEQSKKSMAKLIVILVLYTILSVMGCFTVIETVLFSVFALPFALYIEKEKPSLLMQALFHITMIGINYCFSNNPLLSIAIYSISVIVTPYILSFYCHQQLSLPHFIMYVSISLSVIVFIFFMMIKGIGIDFEQLYINSIDYVKETFMQLTTSIMEMGSANDLNNSENMKLLLENQKYIVDVLEHMKVFYAYTMVTLVVSFSTLTVILYNGLLRKKNKQLPSIKQLIEFRLSKVAVFLLVAAIFTVSSVSANHNAIIVLGLNLMNFFIWLLKAVGGLGLVGLVYRSSASGGLKVLGYIGVAIAFGIFPYMLMIFGCLDAFFNYRKVDIVV